MAPERSSQRLSRLLNLVAALTETHLPLTARQIREKVDGDYGDNDASFRRQFERDKKELRELGIDIVVEEVVDDEGPEAGYRVPRSQYALRLPDLDADEAAALQLAASLVRLDGTQGGAALWKLGADGSGDSDVAGIAAVPGHEQLGALFTAVAARRPVRFGYRGATRSVDPFRLDFARGRWYLLALDHDRGAQRWFRLDRMDGAPVLGPAGTASVPPEGDNPSVPDPWALGDAELVRARVAVDAAQAPLARAVLGDDAVVEEAPDGAIVVELDVSHRDGFRSFVLGFLEHAEVLEPPELRAEVVGWLTAMAAGDGA
ncbi:MAG: WYL domain-containing protein [Acidimicrobiia bacterium]|nr:WYL domain-containing protein [Acidimicrobiia bacterium]